MTSRVLSSNAIKGFTFPSISDISKELTIITILGRLVLTIQPVITFAYEEPSRTKQVHYLFEDYNNRKNMVQPPQF